jgi:uncharacterized protein YjbI with pentapeptide repeats
MTETMTTITAQELVKRLLDGERDFASTRLAPDQADLAVQDGFAELNKYLAGLQDLRDNPIIATNVDWSGLRAPGLYFLGAKMTGANLSGADLRDADIRRADLSGGANFRGANVSGAVFIGSRLMESDFSGATMRGTDLYEANLAGANLSNADLTGAFMLRLNLTDADFTGAKITSVTFYRADLRRARGLDTVQDLATCQFKHTTVNTRERDIIEAAFKALPRFEVRED